MTETRKRARRIRRRVSGVGGDKRIQKKDGPAVRPRNAAAVNRSSGTTRIRSNCAIYHGNRSRGRENAASLPRFKRAIGLEDIPDKCAVDHNDARAATRHSTAPRLTRLHDVPLEGA